MKLIKFLPLAVVASGFIACESDDDAAPSGGGGEGNPTLVVAPATYEFKNSEGNSTVSFTGQTTRLAQGAVILSQLNTFGATEATIDNMFAEGEGFENADLNGTGKKIRNKVAGSVDYFIDNSVEQNEIREDFDNFINSQVVTFLSEYADKDAVPVATEGNAGKLGPRLVNEKGLEYDQAFNKGLIGAWTLDQIINHYLSRLDEGTNRADHDAGIKAEGKEYTNMEHFWDEAYGYLYGASTNLVDPNSIHLEKDNVVDKFLYKYVQRVNGDLDFDTYAAEIFDAFKLGRAAIAQKNYKVRDEQADIIRELLSEVIGIRAVYYLKQGAAKLKSVETINDGSAFHDLSEGYGFVYSLRFTQNPATNQPYFTKEEVDGFIAELDAGNGFWDLADDTTKLEDMASKIAAKFDFTVAQAESTAKAE